MDASHLKSPFHFFVVVIVVEIVLPPERNIPQKADHRNIKAQKPQSETCWLDGGSYKVSPLEQQICHCNAASCYQCCLNCTPFK